MLRECANMEASPERAIALAWQGLVNQHRSQFLSALFNIFDAVRL